MHFDAKSSTPLIEPPTGSPKEALRQLEREVDRFIIEWLAGKGRTLRDLNPLGRDILLKEMKEGLGVRGWGSRTAEDLRLKKLCLLLIWLEEQCWQQFMEWIAAGDEPFQLFSFPEILSLLRSGKPLESSSGREFSDKIAKVYKKALTLAPKSEDKPFYTYYMALIGTPCNKYKKARQEGDKATADALLVTIRANIHDQAASATRGNSERLAKLLDCAIRTAPLADADRMEQQIDQRTAKRLFDDAVKNMPPTDAQRLQYELRRRAWLFASNVAPSPEQAHQMGRAFLIQSKINRLLSPGHQEMKADLEKLADPEQRGAVIEKTRSKAAKLMAGVIEARAKAAKL